VSVADCEIDEPELCEHGQPMPCWQCRREREIERAEQRYERMRDET